MNPLFIRAATLTLFVLCISFGLSAPVQAHVIQKDGAISGLLHVDPYDLPVQKEPARITFELSQSSGKFDPMAYGYVLTVADATSTVFINSLHITQPFIAVPYTFPHDGDFNITLAGVPSSPNVKAFSLSYHQYVQTKDVGVTTIATHVVEEHALHASLPIIFIVVLIVVYVEATLRERRNRRKRAAEQSATV